MMFTRVTKKRHFLPINATKKIISFKTISILTIICLLLLMIKLLKIEPTNANFNKTPEITQNVIKTTKQHVIFTPKPFEAEDEGVLTPLLQKEVEAKPVIFFIHAEKAHSPGLLTAREVCAIESAAGINRNRNLYVLFTNWKYFNYTIKEAANELTAYPNIFFRYINVQELLYSSPFQNLSYLLLSRQYYVELKKLLPFFVIWKYGGIYLDLNMFSFSTFRDLKPNYFGKKTKNLVGAGIMNLEKNHEVIETFLTYLTNSFNKTVFPGIEKALTLTLEYLCRSSYKKDVKVVLECPGFRIYETLKFYPLYGTQLLNSDIHFQLRRLMKLEGGKTIYFENEDDTGDVKMSSLLLSIGNEICWNTRRFISNNYDVY